MCRNFLHNVTLCFRRSERDHGWSEPMLPPSPLRVSPSTTSWGEDAACRPQAGCYACFMEVQMDKTVDVTIPVEADVAAALSHALNRPALRRLLLPGPPPPPLH